MHDTSLTLLARIRSSADEDAWAGLIELYAPLIEHWLATFQLQPADRDDIVQEVLSTLIRELPGFEHNGRSGAFRAWLHTITVNRLREFWRRRQRQPAATGGSDFLKLLDELESPDSALKRLWDADHDRHVVRGLLARVEPDFEPATRKAFRRVVLDGQKPAAVATELGLSVNAVLLAKSRILRHLRRELAGFLS